MEKPKYLFIQPMDMSLKWGGEMLVGGECRVERNKGEKKWDNCNSIINKTYFKKYGIVNLDLINFTPV